jgi:hypothetical protein
VLPAQAASVGLLAAGAEEDLGSQDVLVAGPWWCQLKSNMITEARPRTYSQAPSGRGPSQPRMRHSSRSRPCRRFAAHRVSCGSIGPAIEGSTYNSVVPSSLQNLLDDLTLLGAAVGEPATEREERNLEACPAQVAEFHSMGLVGRGDDGIGHGEALKLRTVKADRVEERVKQFGFSKSGSSMVFNIYVWDLERAMYRGLDDMDRHRAWNR